MSKEKLISPQKAINAFCRECIYDKYSPGSWRKQITECTSRNCPLYHHRPVDALEQTKRKAVKVAAMSPKEKKAYDENRKRLAEIRPTN